MSRVLLGPLEDSNTWFCPLSTVSTIDGKVGLHLVGAVCLRAGEPCETMVVHGRVARVPKPFNLAAQVLVFEDKDDAQAYLDAYKADKEGRHKTEGREYFIASMTPEGVLEQFNQSAPDTIWHVPIPVHHAWGREVIARLRQDGIAAATETATKRLEQHIARG